MRRFLLVGKKQKKNTANGWAELVKQASALGVYKVGMTKEDVVKAIESA